MHKCTIKIKIIPAVPVTVLGDSATVMSRSALGGGLITTTQISTVLFDSLTV